MLFLLSFHYSLLSLLSLYDRILDSINRYYRRVSRLTAFLNLLQIDSIPVSLFATVFQSSLVYIPKSLQSFL